MTWRELPDCLEIDLPEVLTPTDNAVQGVITHSLKCLLVLQKDTTLPAAAFRRAGLSGIGIGGLARKALLVRVALGVYGSDASRWLGALMRTDPLELQRFDLFVFSDRGVFWRRLADGTPAGLRLRIEKSASQLDFDRLRDELGRQQTELLLDSERIWAMSSAGSGR